MDLLKIDRAGDVEDDRHKTQKGEQSNDSNCDRGETPNIGLTTGDLLVEARQQNGHRREGTVATD